MLTDQREGRLLSAAGLFLFLYALVLTVAPAVRAHTWAVGFRWAHWSGLAVWAVGIFIAHRMMRRLPDRDPYLLPLAATLSGWGLMTIWRLEPSLGARQSVWLIVSLAAFLAIPYASEDLGFLRRYKYVLLSSGLLLTALTLLFGTNPSGIGPRLWLGCCGVYLQPSEPLKLLLVAYLSAYLADRIPLRLRFFPMIVPTIVVTGIALALLIVQRDLGTASIFILLYSVVLFLATNRRRVLIVTAVLLLLAGLTGFFFIDVIHARMETWLNPWNDPSGRSFQVIQSLLAIANGATFGRGPGIGNPGLVPVAHSDFIFSAIAEESGLTGTLALLGIYALIMARGFLASIKAPDRYRRLLALGTTAYFGLQALLIMGGNLRLLPLTGVTLPFVSYGGSSLLTSFIALALLVSISDHGEHDPEPLPSLRPFAVLGALLGLAMLAAGMADAWWAVLRGPDLLTRTDNPRRSIADRYVPRGSILDRNNRPIDQTTGSSGTYQRVYLYPPLAPVTGYTHRVFGQAGLEASLDDYLRGTQGNPSSMILLDGLLYGTPPPGLDVRLSIDLELQQQADELLGKLKGAIVLMNASTGEVLAMSSHPGYDPNDLDQVGGLLSNNKDAPLLNRAVQALYPIGTAGAPFALGLGEPDQPLEADLAELYRKLGFYTTPDVRMPAAEARAGDSPAALRVSPLQMADAASVLSDDGARPVPRLALAVNTPQQGWVVLPALGQAGSAFSPSAADQAAAQLTGPDGKNWQWTGLAQAGQEINTWFIGGTPPNWTATPFAVAVLIEGSYPMSAERIGHQLLQSAMRP